MSRNGGLRRRIRRGNHAAELKQILSVIFTLLTHYGAPVHYGFGSRRSGCRDL